VRAAALRRYFAIERTPGAIPELDSLRALAVLAAAPIATRTMAYARAESWTYLTIKDRI
jgi:hypothetical protein